jgi:hypothetical protein
MMPQLFQCCKRSFEQGVEVSMRTLSAVTLFGFGDEDTRKFIIKGLAMRETEKDDPETKTLGRQILKKLR